MNRNSASVSAIIPVFNSSDSLNRCLKSITDQSVQVEEVIIIDDFSSMEDYIGTQEVADRFKGSLNIRIHRLDSNKGAGEARNMGVKLASQKYIAFLDSDDVWHPRKIEIQYKFMEHMKSVMSGHTYIPDLTKFKGNPQISPNFYRLIYGTEFLLRNPYSTPTVMILRDKFLEFPDMRFSEDYACWILNFRRGKSHFISIPLAAGFKAPVGASGLSSNMEKMHHGVLAGLKYLRRQNSITLGFYILATAFEKIKWPLRRKKWHKI